MRGAIPKDDRPRFGWSDDDGIRVSQCAFCKHKRKGATCAAFPKLIPELILANKHDHRNPIEGDHGIQFEAIPGHASPFEGKAK